MARRGGRSQSRLIPMPDPRVALYPGTFDPVTNGHVDIIGRAARLGPVVGLDGDLHLPHRVLFHASLGQGRSLPGAFAGAADTTPAPSAVDIDVVQKIVPSKRIEEVVR